MADELDDPTVLTGMAKMVNPRKVNDKLDLESIERDLMNNGGLKPMVIKDTERELSDILRDIRTEPIHSGHSTGGSLGKLQNFVNKTNPSIPFGSDADDEADSEDIENFEDEFEEIETSAAVVPPEPPRPAYYPP